MDAGTRHSSYMNPHAGIDDLSVLDALNGVRLMVYGKMLELNIKPPAELKMQPKEAMPAYMQRVIDYCMKNEDWSLLVRALSTAAQMQMIGVASSEDMNLARLLSIAQKQEQADYVAGAVGSYLAALKTSSRLVPVKLIKEKLDQLKKKSPEEYAEGLQLAEGVRESIPLPQNTMQPERSSIRPAPNEFIR